jgi:hypothetical protein
MTTTWRCRATGCLSCCWWEHDSVNHGQTILHWGSAVHSHLVQCTRAIPQHEQECWRQWYFIAHTENNFGGWIIRQIMTDCHEAVNLEMRWTSLCATTLGEFHKHAIAWNRELHPEILVHTIPTLAGGQGCDCFFGRQQLDAIYSRAFGVPWISSYLLTGDVDMLTLWHFIEFYT